MANEPQATTPESGAATSIEKFKTPEERDKAYLELEKFSHTQAQRLADLEKKLDEFAAQPQPQAQDNRSFTDMYPGARPNVDQNETELASQLLTRPSEVLKRHAEYVRQQTLREAQALIAAQDAVNRFRTDHPDLAKHEEIVTMFVNKQPTNLPASERLKRAIPEVRSFINGIAKGSNPATPNLDPATYVEAPSSQAAVPTATPVQEQPDDELSDFIKERSAWQAKKRLG